MKIHLLILSFAVITNSAFSQSSIPNGNFENWTSATFYYPEGYPYSSNNESFFRFNLPFNVTKSTDSYNGNYAVQLITNTMPADSFLAYFVNSNYIDGPNWHGGIAYNQIPTGVRGYYKYNVPSGDSALIIASFSNNGTNIGMYFFKLGGVHSTYTLFDFTLNPPLSVTPDSVVFAATSSDFIDGISLNGSTLLLDSVSFTGVVAQPTLLNGDFETWQSQVLEKVDSWITQSDNGAGVSKTLNSYAGNYAIELTTTLDSDQNNNPRAYPGNISTGYWDNSCNCMKGGFPFANQIDTLAFYYKYTPSGNDTASIFLNFKKNSASIWGTNIAIFSSSNYQYMEIPFNTFQSPDTVILQIQSSTWYDSLVTFVGSDLIIDEIHFKSQPLSINIFANYFKNNKVLIYPNPIKTSATIEINANTDIKEMELQILDITGKVIKSLPVDKYKITINKDDLNSGMYFYNLKVKEKTFYNGKFVIE